MAATLPGAPPPFDRGDVGGTVKAICEYLRGLQESLSFHMGYLQKTQQNAGGEALAAGMENLENRIGSISSALTVLRGQLAQLSESVSAMEERIAALEKPDAE